MSICSIMQPTFLPWAGYFSLISLSNHFIFLDDVQLAKQSWQTRNQILLSGKPFWLSVPVFHKKLDQLINQTEIDDRTRWRNKQIKTIDNNYRKAPYFAQLSYILDIISDSSITTLHVLNMRIIRETCQKLQLASQLLISSDYVSKSEDRTGRLIDLCKAVHCSTYIGPSGAKEYLLRDAFADKGDIELKIFSFTPEPYPQIQKTGDFASHLSFVDVIANISIAGFYDYISNPNSIHLEAIEKRMQTSL